MTSLTHKASLLTLTLIILSAGGIKAQASYFSLEKTSFAAGETIAIRFAAPMKSPEGDQSWITVVAPSAGPEEYAEFIYVADGAAEARIPAPAKAGDFEVRLHTNYPAKDYNLVQSVGIAVSRTESAAASGLRFKSIYARYSNSDRNWSMDFSSEETGSMRTRYSNSIGTWDIELPTGTAGIKAQYSNSDTSWVYAGVNGLITIKTRFSNSLSPWEITSASGQTLTAATVYSNSIGKWSISGIGEGMAVYATYSNSLLKWTIEDGIPEVDPDLKMAALFACIISTLIK